MTKSQPYIYSALDKDTIEMEIVSYLPLPKGGFPLTVPLVEIVNAILYKRKTGDHWDQLPTGIFFWEKLLSWESVYYHYRKWCKDGVWKSYWTGMLNRHRSELDLSSVDLEGSHTPALRGGDEVAYQGRKKCKATIAIYLSDRQGLPIAMSGPLAGYHNDLYNIEVQFEVFTATHEQVNIAVEGPFLNEDAEFDSKEFRNSCEKKEINANVCFNKRNGNSDRNEYFDQRLYKLSGQTHGWIAIVHF